MYFYKHEIKLFISANYFHIICPSIHFLLLTQTHSGAGAVMGQEVGSTLDSSPVNRRPNT